MQYERVVKGRFLSRPNRFIAHVETEGRVEVCHVKNTGRCRELLVPGAAVYLSEAENPLRKTRYDLVAVEKGTRLINMDAAAPNRVFGEWAAAGGLGAVPEKLRPEVVFEDSRFDFRLEMKGKVRFVEVKGVTLEEEGEVRFPDAPTERGVKHLKGLRRAVEAGFGATVFFVVQMENVSCFRPNDATHPAFGQALREAAAQGVQVMAYDCRVTPESMVIRAPVRVVL
ncbi:MAG: DNA/RNA nuclease SfsA [Oscillospiraceae bacterium]|jgi:sugar fermentation stimulation protein A|nr:DNA/RNA nuclease SfsA [Oscillospiraceae bacterium]